MPYIALIILLCAAPLYAFEGILPASQSMAANTAASEGYAAVYENPAGLILDKSCRITVSQARLLYDTYAYDMGVSSPINVSGQASAFMQFSYAAGFYQEIRRNLAVIRILLNADGTPMIDPVSGEIMQETAGFADKVYSRLNLGCSASLGPLSAGISVSGIEAQHGIMSGWGLSANAGIVYEVLPGLRLAAAAKNIGRTTLSWTDSREDRDPMRLTAGIAFSVFERVAISADAGCEFDRSYVFLWGAGAEVAVLEQLKLKAGYAGGTPRIGLVFTAGKFRLDCAYLINVNFYDAARLSASLEF